MAVPRSTRAPRAWAEWGLTLRSKILSTHGVGEAHETPGEVRKPTTSTSPRRLVRAASSPHEVLRWLRAAAPRSAHLQGSESSGEEVRNRSPETSGSESSAFLQEILAVCYISPVSHRQFASPRLLLPLTVVLLRRVLLTCCTQVPTTRPAYNGPKPCELQAKWLRRRLRAALWCIFLSAPLGIAHLRPSEPNAPNNHHHHHHHHWSTTPQRPQPQRPRGL